LISKQQNKTVKGDESGRTQMEPAKERRRYQRYSVKPGVFALLGPDSSRMGRIIDISPDGLAFLYKNGRDKLARFYKMSILFDDSPDSSYSPFIFNVKVVSDVEIENESPFSSAVIKRFGMQFDDLTYYQKAWLAECIRDHTNGVVECMLSLE
jgi:hypothetical protein